jgi:hypothetical protein
VNRIRSQFESERKAHRTNLYNSILRDDHRSVDVSFEKPSRTQSDTKALMNPRWNKSLVKNFNTKRRLFDDHNNYSNYSVAVPQDKEQEFITG